MFKRILLVTMILGLSIGLIPLNRVFATPHTQPVSSTCEALSVNLTGYTATVPANPGQPYIAPTYKTVTIPAVAQISHDEYKYKATKQYGSGSNTIYATTTGTSSSSNNADWLLSAPSKISNYSNWIQIDHRVVIDLAATPAHDIVVIDNPGQPYIAPTPEKTNTVQVDIDSANVENTTFSTSYSNTFTYSNKYLAHDYHVVVTAWDGHGSFTTNGTSVPCDNTDTNIDICHANEGIKHFVSNTVDYDSIIKHHGHGSHEDDIIPPFDYYKDGVLHHFAGLNWDAEGQSTYNNGCVDVPTKPADIVTVTTSTKVNCETQTVTITTTTTTTGTVLVDNEWVATEPVVTEETSTREATQEEVTECIPDKPADIVTVVTTVDPVDCDKGTVTQTVKTTTISSVLEGIEWVAGEPVVKTETSTRPATSQELLTCKDTGEVLGGSTIKSLPVTSGDMSTANIVVLASITAFAALVSIIARSALTRRI